MKCCDPRARWEEALVKAAKLATRPFRAKLLYGSNEEEDAFTKRASVLIPA
jgi:hypothetical protein